MTRESPTPGPILAQSSQILRPGTWAFNFNAPRWFNPRWKASPANSAASLHEGGNNCSPKPLPKLGWDARSGSRLQHPPHKPYHCMCVCETTWNSSERTALSTGGDYVLQEIRDRWGEGKILCPAGRCKGKAKVVTAHHSLSVPLATLFLNQSCRYIFRNLNAYNNFSKSTSSPPPPPNPLSPVLIAKCGKGRGCRLNWVTKRQAREILCFWKARGGVPERNTSTQD